MPTLLDLASYGILAVIVLLVRVCTVRAIMDDAGNVNENSPEV